MSIHLSAKLILSASPGSEMGHTLSHWCPGCNCRHLIPIEKPNAQGARWTWDENLENPTFTPSVNIEVATNKEGVVIKRCHYIITAGKIQYCADSTHTLSGQTVDLPVIPLRA